MRASKSTFDQVCCLIGLTAVRLRLSLLLFIVWPVVAIEVINTVTGSTRQLTGADNLALFQVGQGSALTSSYGLDIQTGACLQCLPGEVIKGSPLDNTAEWLAQSPLIQETLQNVASPKRKTGS